MEIKIEGYYLHLVRLWPLGREEPTPTCQLTMVWMFYSTGVNNKINHLHERALRIIYKDNSSSFENLLEKDGSCSIHHRNIQSLAIELFKIKTNVSNDIIYDIFNTREIKYNLRSQTDFSGHCVNTNKFGINSLKFLRLKYGKLFLLR